jgi:hypothetical protein
VILSRLFAGLIQSDHDLADLFFGAFEFSLAIGHRFGEQGFELPVTFGIGDVGQEGVVLGFGAEVINIAAE